MNQLQSSLEICLVETIRTWRLLLQPGLQPGCKQLQQPRPRVQSWQLESGWSMPSDYSKTFTDQNGRTHGGCRRADESGRTWCYTTG